MATMRQHVWIDRPAGDVWEVVGDAASVTRWFPGMESVTVDGTSRVITLASGLPLQEEVVSVRNDLRRFQYRLLGPLPVQHHLASIDVIGDGEGRCVVVYSTDVDPPALAPILDGAARDALDSLRTLLEAS
jgi:hypothetical protein